MEENHYYPFGLKHNGYSPTQKIFAMSAPPHVVLTPVINSLEVTYKVKYQGQERQDEFGLNWDSFKYRNYDNAIGRFFTIDPLAEKYPGWSTYVFSGNRVIDAREFEGLEPHVLFNSKNAAASNFSKLYNGVSIVDNLEYVSKIYETTDMHGKIVFAYAKPVKGTPAGATPSSVDIPEGTTLKAVVHTHGAYDVRYANDRFSGRIGDASSFGDMGYAERHSVDIYVATPNGSFQRYDVIKNKITTLSTSMASDPLHPNRLNNKNPMVPIAPSLQPLTPLTPSIPIQPIPIQPIPIQPAPIQPAPIVLPEEDFKP